MNLICGINPVLEALQAGTRHFDRLIVVKGLRNSRIADAIGRAGKLGVPLRFESRETLDRMAGGVSHQGLIAVVSAKPTVDLDTLLAQARDPALLVALDGVEDPRNLGAILRTCEAAGADGVLLPDRHSVGLTETVGRASAGALEHVRVARVGNLSQALEAMKARGLWTIGFDAAGGRRWDAVDYKRPVALILGGEGRGMRRLVRERCDELVSIPLFGHITSLNVSVAAAVALYEAVRQRGAMPSHVRPIPPRAQPPARHVEGPGEGDPEHDPGAPPAVAARGPAEDGEDELEQPLYVVREIDEELAWGPALDPEPASEPRERERHHHRPPPPQQQPREHRESREPRDGRGPGGQSGHGQDEGSGRGPGRPGRGRRRRRRHGGGGPGGGEHRPPQAQQQPPAEPRNTEEGGRQEGAPTPGGQPGRRRRRRWRRRPGGGPGGGTGGEPGAGGPSGAPQ